jgi:hypothetical protein
MIFNFKTTRHYFFISILLIQCVISVQSQSSVGIGTLHPHTSAVLDIASNTKGVLIPSMTSQDRINIASPAAGLLVFDVSTQSIWFYHQSNLG